MKILLTCLQYQGLTGSEMYVYELSKELKRRGHDVAIFSHAPQFTELIAKTAELGIKILINTGDIPLFQPDIIHGSQTQTIEQAIQMFPSVPVVQTVHSEVLPAYESPVLHDQVKHYICIRPSIRNFVVNCGIEKSRTTILFNGFDTERFKKEDDRKKSDEIPTVLFVGSLDYLRSRTVIHLLAQAKDNLIRLVLVGRGFKGMELELPESIKKNVICFGPTWNVEQLTKNCTETAGIMVGRTTIEGWLCGKPARIYTINDQGDIQGVKKVYPGKDLKRYDIRYMTDKVEAIYQKVLND